MESKHLGDLRLTLYETAQELLSIYQRLDPKGYERASGVVASGVVSFGRIYSALNETLRRGGKYKNGAIVLHLDANHPDIEDFIETPREVLPWCKRCVNISQEWWDEHGCHRKAEAIAWHQIRRHLAKQN